MDGSSDTEVLEAPNHTDNTANANLPSSSEQANDIGKSPISLLEKLIANDQREQEIEEAIDRIRDAAESGRGLSSVSADDKITLLAVIEAGGRTWNNITTKKPEPKSYKDASRPPLQGGSMNQE